MTERLVARGVRAVLGGTTVLASVDLEVEPGTMTLLAGRNGSGKSTLLSVLAGQRRPASGSVRLGARDVAAVSARERATRIAFIPQDPDTPFEFTGRELVMMGRHPHIARFASPAARDREVVQRALVQLDATAFADRPVTTLSGGERQRVGIARALATEAPILLADEPTANLDLDHSLAVLELLSRFADDGGSVLLVSHDLNTVAPYADRVMLLHAGCIACAAAPAEALSPERVEQVFGVQSGPPAGFFPRAFAPRR